MKRLVLIVMAVMAFAGMNVAQDVYTAGYYTSSSGAQYAAVYKNGDMLYDALSGGSSYTSTSTDVVYHNGNVFWVENTANSSGEYYFGDVFKNSTRYLSNPTGSGSHINAIFHGNNLWSVGCKTINGVQTAVAWKNDNNSPQYTLGSGSYKSEAYGVTIDLDGNVWICGVQYTSETAYSGKIWKNGVEQYDLGANICLKDIAVYNGNVYTVGLEGGSTLKVWYNSSVKYTLTTSSSQYRCNINIDAGDIYVAGFDSSPDKIWKNGEMIHSSSTHYYHAVVANSNGVYYAGGNTSGAGKIWKDGNEIYAPSNCKRILGMYVGEPECADTEIRSLPFEDGFENGETAWACWTKVDVDNNNGLKPAFWDRCGETFTALPYTGSHFARHYYHGTNNQEGWLISPRLFLQPGRDYTTLSFMSYEWAPEDYTYEGVWISTSGTSTSNFTEIWSQSDPTEDWNSVDIDLTDYQGQAVYIAFKYTGNNGHVWCIDDVSVTEGWATCGTYSVPSIYDFDYWDITSTCWYIIDNDMSGDGRNWKYNSSEQCAYHPWGQPNTPQEGWLISMSFELPAGQNYLLTFDEKNSSSGTNMKNSVLVAVDADPDEVPETSNFTQVWSDNSNFPTSWTQRTIDLTAYAGHTINIAFKYEGTFAHNWFIDNFAIDASTPEYSINVVANNAAWGTVTGTGTYQQGENVTITATPSTGYEFKQWTKGGETISTSPVYNFTATEDATYTAVFGEPEVVYYNIIADVNPEGAGTVEGGNTYAAGATAYLTATANTGWQFSHWHDGITSNPRAITVNGDASYTAYFTQLNYTISAVASPAEGGTVTGGGSYHYGDMVTLTATANEGYVFNSWSDGETNSTRSVSVTGNATYTAIFSEEGVTTYTITVLANDPSLGMVTGSGTYPEGSVITISAVPGHQAHFVKWNDGNTNSIRDITVTQDATFTAIFEADRMYTIIVESGDPNMGSVTGGGTFAEGTVITISATANSGYYFTGWNDGNAENPRNITVTQNATYKALFSQDVVVTYTVNVMCNSSEGTVIGSGTYTAGSVITIAAIPNSGYEFDKWNDENTQNPRQVTVNDNLVFVAFFRGTGVDENGASAFTIYPNPANESIRIAGIEANSEVRIFNSLGMLVKVVNVGADQEIGISELAAGLYVARCGNSAMRFVKQ